MYRNKILALLAVSVLASASALAQEAPPAAAPGDRWTEMQKMTPEQREAARQAAQERWESMTQEEQQAARAQHEEHRATHEEHRAKMQERWESMTPEEREAAKAKHEEHRAEMRKRWESMTPEEREAAKAKHAEHGGSMHGPDGSGKQPGGPRSGDGGG